MSFVEDFKKLQFATPRLAIINTNSENSAYTNYSTFNRNCYLCFGTHYSEDAYYSQYGVGLNSCADSFDLEKSELCYEMVFSEKCYGCSYGSYLIACTDCEFCHDMSNGTKCFLSIGLQNQSYCILNQPVSKEEYAEKRKFYLKNYSTKELLRMLDELRQKTP